MNTDDLIYESDLNQERIVAPCGSDATGNVVSNENYDESGYLPQWQCYTKWLEKVTYFNQKSEFIRINSKFAQLTPEIKERSTAISESPVDILNRM